jgi:hypothetical protein
LGGRSPSDFFCGSSCSCNFLIDSSAASLAFARGLVSSQPARCAFLKEKGSCSSVKFVVLVPPLGAPLTPTSNLSRSHVRVKLWASGSGSTRAGRSQQSGWHQVRPKPPSQPGEVWCLVRRSKPPHHPQPAETRPRCPDKGSFITSLPRPHQQPPGRRWVGERAQRRHTGPAVRENSWKLCTASLSTGWRDSNGFLRAMVTTIHKLNTS